MICNRIIFQKNVSGKFRISVDTVFYASDTFVILKQKQKKFNKRCTCFLCDSQIVEPGTKTCHQKYSTKKFV